MATKYAAQFADGTRLTRSSERGYSHAWRTSGPARPGFSYREASGFACSEKAARAAARASIPSGSDPCRSAAKKAERRREHSEYAALCTIEVVFTEVVA
jgi:hypothetical protein